MSLKVFKRIKTDIKTNYIFEELTDDIPLSLDDNSEYSWECHIYNHYHYYFSEDDDEHQNTEQFMKHYKFLDIDENCHFDDYTIDMGSDIGTCYFSLIKKEKNSYYDYHYNYGYEYKEELSRLCEFSNEIIDSSCHYEEYLIGEKCKLIRLSRDGYTKIVFIITKN